MVACPRFSRHTRAPVAAGRALQRPPDSSTRRPAHGTCPPRHHARREGGRSRLGPLRDEEGSAQVLQRDSSARRGRGPGCPPGWHLAEPATQPVPRPTALLPAREHDDETPPGVTRSEPQARRHPNGATARDVPGMPSHRAWGRTPYGTCACAWAYDSLIQGALGLLRVRHEPDCARLYSSPDGLLLYPSEGPRRRVSRVEHHARGPRHPTRVRKSRPGYRRQAQPSSVAPRFLPIASSLAQARPSSYRMKGIIPSILRAIRTDGMVTGQRSLPSPSDEKGWASARMLSTHGGPCAGPPF